MLSKTTRKYCTSQCTKGFLCEIKRVKNNCCSDVAHSEFCEPRATVIQLPWHNISGAEQVSKKRYLNNKIQRSCEGGSGSKKLYSIMWILILFHVTLPVFRIRIHLSESSSIWIRIRFQIQWVTILTRTFSTGFPVIQMLPQTSKEQRTRKS